MNALLNHPSVTRHRLTVEDYYRMADAGILRQDDRVELIEGEIVDRVPIGSSHSGSVKWLASSLFQAVGARAVVTVQNPLRLDRFSEPQPDFLLLKPRADFYRERHPLPEDVLLLIEVAASSLAYDRDVKLPLYARHGIPEFWIVDLGARKVEICRDPGSDGYASIVAARAADVVEPFELPGLRIPLAGLFG